MEQYLAVEGRASIDEAIAKLMTACGRNQTESTELGTISDGANGWQIGPRLFGHIRPHDKPSFHYFIGFRRDAGSWRSCVFQANIAPGRYFRQFAGMFASDANDQLWLLHDGRLKLPIGMLRKGDIERFGFGRRVSVRFNDGKAFPYYPVANLDASSGETIRQIERYLMVATAARHEVEDGLLAPEAVSDPNVLDRFGPPPHDGLGDPLPRRNIANLPACCYVLRFADTQTWKVGWALDASARLTRIRTHLPLHLDKETWNCYAEVAFRTADIAYDMEQHVLRNLRSSHRVVREQVICDEREIAELVEFMKQRSPNGLHLQGREH